nr:hypothetical protein [Gemmobacter sp.]
MGQGERQDGGLCGGGYGPGLRRCPWHQQAELLAAQTGREGPPGGQRAGQGLGHLLQRVIARLMAETVVEGLETVKIQHSHRPAFPVLRLSRQPDLGLAIQMAAIRQAGQRVGHRFAIAQTGEEILPPIGIFAQVAARPGQWHRQQQHHRDLQALAQGARVMGQHGDQHRGQGDDQGRAQRPPEQEAHGKPGCHHDHDHAAIGRKTAIQPRQMPGKTGRKAQGHIAEPGQPGIGRPAPPRRHQAQHDQRHHQPSGAKPQQQLAMGDDARRQLLHAQHIQPGKAQPDSQRQRPADLRRTAQAIPGFGRIVLLDARLEAQQKETRRNLLPVLAQRSRVDHASRHGIPLPSPKIRLSVRSLGANS